MSISRVKKHVKAPQRELLTMDRSGEFKIKATGDHHCGTEEDLYIRYNMICECTVKTDHRGFLFDQVNVDNFFQSIKRSTLSCEKLTIQCAKKLLKLIAAENPVCEILRMELTLAPKPYAASMTYAWAATDAVKKEKDPRITRRFTSGVPMSIGVSQTTTGY